MLIIKSIKELNKIINCWHNDKQSISFIPTMGSLHEGHLSLIKSVKNNSKVVVSIFINPMQFNQLSDLLNYPRNFKNDCNKLVTQKVDLLFAPLESEMYPNGFINNIYLDQPNFTNIIEGKSRVGHFRGMLTIISKLFNLIKPDMAFFGEKDFQQLFLIKKLVHDMNYNIKIIGVPTVRDINGLALSSRNINLNLRQKKIAVELFKTINYAVSKFFSKKYSINDILVKSSNRLKRYGLKPDILDIRDAETLLPLSNKSNTAVLLFSAWIDQTRLIDNIQININNLPKK